MCCRIRDWGIWLPARAACRLRAGAALVALLVASPAAQADIFHLTTGGTIEGQRLGSEGGQYKIRTMVGVVSLPVSDVERVEETTSPFDEYDRRLASMADTPEAQTELANWCEEQGLRVERRRHLTRAIELDSNYAPARRALGYVRVGDMWVDGRRVVERGTASAPAENEEPAERERLARAIQGQWNRRIRAIRQNLLENHDERLVREGRTKIVEIRDPLAILPLAEVLSGGGTMCRDLLVDVLAGFPDDEATMNLAAVALLDRSPEVRQRSLVELARRRDPRVVAQYREALVHGGDAILARAATGLGRLGAAEAVPDLVDALTARRNKWVEMPVRQFFAGWSSIFYRVSATPIAAGVQIVPSPRLGVPHDAVYFESDAEREWQYRSVTVYRTEVLEALKKLTGENFGFERQRWLQWIEESRR